LFLEVTGLKKYYNSTINDHKQLKLKFTIKNTNNETTQNCHRENTAVSAVELGQYIEISAIYRRYRYYRYPIDVGVINIVFFRERERERKFIFHIATTLE